MYRKVLKMKMRTGWHSIALLAEMLLILLLIVLWGYEILWGPKKKKIAKKWPVKFNTSYIYVGKMTNQSKDNSALIYQYKTEYNQLPIQLQRQN